MRKVVFFMFTTLDGFFDGREKGGLSWHHVDEEFVSFSLKQIWAVVEARPFKSGNVLLRYTPARA